MGYVSEDWSILIDPRIHPTQTDHHHPCHHLTHQHSSFPPSSCFMITNYHVILHEIMTYHNIITPYAQPMLYSFPCIHSHVFHFGSWGSLIQPLWLWSWLIGCSTDPAVLHEANPPGQVLMPVYSDTLEGLMKTSSYPPWCQYIFHLSILDCFTFILPFIWSMRTLTMLTRCSHAIVLIVLAQCGTTFPFE